MRAIERVFRHAILLNSGARQTTAIGCNVNARNFSTTSRRLASIETVDVGTIEQSNGSRLPRLGLGTWLAKDHDELQTALRAALDAGYRYIDTATGYKNEHVIGQVLQEYYDAGKLKREEIWLTTKLPFYGWESEAAEKILAKSLKNLRTDYIDLYLLHTPFCFKPKADLSGAERDENSQFIPLEISIAELWKNFFEKHYNEGVFKSIGVSNFNAAQLQALYYNSSIKPHNLQIEFHILWRQQKLRDFAKTLGLSVTGYSPLGSPGREESTNTSFVPGNAMGQKEVIELAKKHSKSPAQILVRADLQWGVSVIPKSTTLNHLRENLQVFDFELSDDDMQMLESVKEEQRLLILDFAKHHKEYPFSDQEPQNDE